MHGVAEVMDSPQKMTLGLCPILGMMKITMPQMVLLTFCQIDLQAFTFQIDL